MKPLTGFHAEGVPRRASMVGSCVVGSVIAAHEMI